MPWKKEKKGMEMNVCFLLVPVQSHMLPPSWESQGRAGGRLQAGSGQFILEGPASALVYINEGR